MSKTYLYLLVVVVAGIFIEQVQSDNDYSFRRTNYVSSGRSGVHFTFFLAHSYKIVCCADKDHYSGRLFVEGFGDLFGIYYPANRPLSARTEWSLVGVENWCPWVTGKDVSLRIRALLENVFFESTFS